MEAFEDYYLDIVNMHVNQWKNNSLFAYLVRFDKSWSELATINPMYENPEIQLGNLKRNHAGVKVFMEVITQSEVTRTHMHRRTARQLIYDEFFLLVSKAAKRYERANSLKISDPRMQPMSSRRRQESSANRRGLQVNVGTIGAADDDSENSYDYSEESGDDIDYDVHRNEQGDVRKRRPPIPEKAKLPKYVFDKVMGNRDTQVWFNLKEDTRIAIASACNQLDPKTEKEKKYVADQAVQRR